MFGNRDYGFKGNAQPDQTSYGFGPKAGARAEEAVPAGYRFGPNTGAQTGGEAPRGHSFGPTVQDPTGRDFSFGQGGKREAENSTYADRDRTKGDAPRTAWKITAVAACVAVAALVLSMCHSKKNGQEGADGITMYKQPPQPEAVLPANAFVAQDHLLVSTIDINGKPIPGGPQQITKLPCGYGVHTRNGISGKTTDLEFPNGVHATVPSAGLSLTVPVAGSCPEAPSPLRLRQSFQGPES